MNIIGLSCPSNRLVHGTRPLQRPIITHQFNKIQQHDMVIILFYSLSRQINSSYIFSTFTNSTIHANIIISHSIQTMIYNTAISLQLLHFQNHLSISRQFYKIIPFNHILLIKHKDLPFKIIFHKITKSDKNHFR